MRVLRTVAWTLALSAAQVIAQDAGAPVSKEKHEYQSDVARLRKIVINSLYSHRDVFLRELLSNANDANEKLRLTALTDKSVWDGASPLNISIKAVKDEGGKGGRIIISDTGIGMTAEEMKLNLGTLARSGTTEFLQKAEGTDTSGTGNLIGAFGLGFYSSFLVADRVLVSSIAPKSPSNPDPVQHIFSSSADDQAFEIYPDPRGNTIGRGTEITLFLKDDAVEYLEEHVLAGLVNKHSSFASSFPIYLWSTRTEEVPDETTEPAETSIPKESPVPKEKEEVAETDEEEAIVEEVKEDKEEPITPAKTKTVVVEEWSHINPQQPLWMRDPKNITDEEYTLFYQGTFKDFSKPLAWHQFSGDADGVTFKAIIFIPSKLEEQFWQQTLPSGTKDVKLFVKRVFITSDLGEDGLPKWASFVKAIVDADDLPLNVSRETLQSNRFMKQIKQAIVKRIIQLFTRIAEEDQEKFDEIQKTFGTVLKLGGVEDQKNREKLTALTRFPTNQRANASLDEYLANKKEGQKQIFYLAELGKSKEDLAKSVFVEKLTARGYEVLLFNEPLDEILTQNLRKWKNVPFQDVAKAGLKFGDEDPEAEKEEQAALTEKFQPLLTWLKGEAQNVVRSVIISNRLISSPCAIVADAQGYTANVEKLMSASNRKKQGTDFMYEYAKKQKVLEINPKSPLIEGLLKRVEELPSADEVQDPEAESELKEVASILIDGALVRSGFEVPDSNVFFTRVDRVLRRSLGVSETAPTDTTVKPAPPVDPKLPEEPEDDIENIIKGDWQMPESMKDKVIVESVEEIDEEGNPISGHDEL